MRFACRAIVPLLSLLLLLLSNATLAMIRKRLGLTFDDEPSTGSYTAFDDASWAVMSKEIGRRLGRHVRPLYESFLVGCQEAVDEAGKGQQNCRTEETHRVKMNSEQPSSCRNFTEKGFEKITAPEAIFEKLMEFYEANKGSDVVEWNHINTYHNMWDSPPSIMRLGGENLQSEIYDLVRPVLEEWTGMKLRPVSLYGIRLYHAESILAPHVDRMPLVTSCIINLDQDVDEDWPLEVYGHDGVATNVTMVPGDMVLYESHSVIHGRPFPFRGRYYANVFVHFEPTGPLDPDKESEYYDPIQDLPPYLIPGSPWEKNWRENNPMGFKGVKHDAANAARQGNNDVIEALAKTARKSLHKEDDLGWQPLHEAVRAGHKETVQLLLLHGADLNSVTKTGYSPLGIAKHYLEEGHDVISFLESIGAEHVDPEL